MDGSYRAPHDDSAPLDAVSPVSLHLSANGAFDDFDFHLGDDDRQGHPEDAVRCFAGSNHSAELWAATLMDFEKIDGSLKDSFNAACSIQDDGEPPGHSHGSSAGVDGSHRRSGIAKRRQRRMVECFEGSDPEKPQAQANPRVPMKAVNFDPPTAEQQLSLQLDRLAESMKRTEESRRCVLLQRALLFTPEQLRQVQDTKAELQRRQAVAVRLCRAQQRQRHALPGSLRLLADAASPADATPWPFQNTASDAMALPANPADRSSVVASLLSGSRVARTHGPGQRRRQLEAYMTTV